MFGWFRPTCPCDPVAKRWIEDRLAWLSRQFGLHILLERSVILPTADFFPDPWDGSEAAAQRMFRRVCDYMGVNPHRVEIEFFNDRSHGSIAHDPTLRGISAGTWQGSVGFNQGTIRVNRGWLDRPSDLVGTMAHELAHQRLLGEGRFDAEEFDNELLTDLTAIFFGFGVFLANNPRKSTGELSRWPGTELRMPEYISEPMLAYSLAHIAWLQDEIWPPWAGHLRWAPRAAFKQGWRYLEKTGHTTFKPVRLRVARADRD